MNGQSVHYVVVDEAQEWLDARDLDAFAPHPDRCHCRECIVDELDEDDYR